MADHLPSEVITDILCRVPANSLLRFRSISKWWRSLIDSTHFIFLHLHKTTYSFLILRQHSHLYRIDLDSPNQAVEIDHPLMCYSNRIKILGSCNGLLCICNIADDIALWNPTLRKHRILPSEPLNRNKTPEENINNNTTFCAAHVHGFGYDSFSGDYKLVSISYFVDLQRGTFDSKVKLFSLRMDSWKSLPSLPYALCCARTMGVFVGGALHWVVTRKLEPDQPDLVVAFDLRLESFKEVELPETVKGNFDMNVALLGGCLSVTENRGVTEMGMGGFDVWVLKVYGSRDSWCKLLTVAQLCEVKNLRPLAYSRNGDGDKVLMEQDRSKLCWYDLKNGDVSCARISGLPSLIEGIVCVGSLVPPKLLSPTSDDSRSELHRLGHGSTRKRRDDFLSKGFKLTL
ncbi:F-box protein CPR1-like [Lotus japonicus]|uniref:F-box protein CPR1-like n=1 Tax=Lotus japonicus TaxID=34305 RepID=UPI00258D8596|nr:F-box protein CPR1-like [Lotus japonicus]